MTYSQTTAPPTWQTASDERSCVFENHVMTECIVKICIVVCLINIKRKLKKSLRMRTGRERAAGCGHSQLFPPTASPLVSAVNGQPIGLAECRNTLSKNFYCNFISVLYFTEAILLVLTLKKNACEVLNSYELT